MTGSNGDEAYCEQRKQWGEDRGVSWILKNRRPEKLRDTLKELEVRKLALDNKFLPCTAFQNERDSWS